MRVLFVSTSTTVGGAEKTLYSLATLLNPRKYTVCEAVSLKPFGEYAKKLDELGVRTKSLALRGRPSLRELRALAAEIDYQKPDIVHAIMYQAIQLCRLAKTRCEHKFKLVSSPRINYRTRSALTLLVDRVLKGRDDLLIAESESSRKYLLGSLGYAPAKVQTIYNGIDLANWPVSKLDRQRKRLELRLGGNEIVVGSVGRLDEQKGHAFLIEAVHKLRNKLPIRCAIIGEGPKRRSLETQIRRLRLENFVWLLGERPDVVQWLSAFDLFALPSLWEGMPNALLEAMALGIPCVASSVDGVPEAIKNGESGLLVPARDASALAKALARLADDGPYRAKLGEGGRKIVADHFTLLGMIENYEKAYDAL